MSEINRRRFFQLTGGTVAMSALSTSIARAADIPAYSAHGSVQDVEHIVVLMQENRSFDHYFGTLRGVRGFGDPHPVTLPSGKPVWHQSDGRNDVLPFRAKADDLGMKFLQGTDHGWPSGHGAWNQGRYDKWVVAKGTPTTMTHLAREDIPFHYALADAFTVCDAYHCSLMGPTDPNRYYMWTGYVGNDGTGGGPVVDNDELGYSWTTYPERLEQAGVTWKIYQDVGDGLDAAGSWGWISDAYRGNFGDNSLLYFDQYRSAAPGDPLYEKARTGTDARNGDGFFDILRADVASGKLPQVSWIVAPEAFSEHPNWPVNYGAWYIAQVLDALTSDPEVWSRTALLVTYDENDGYFDHVVPPYPPSSAAQGQSTANVSTELFDPSTAAPQYAGYPAGPYGAGQRVPMIVVSPWSKGGWVCSETFDHTSVIRFIEKRFGVHEPNISPWRRALCGDLTAAFDFSHTQTAVPHLPDTSGYVPADDKRHPDYVPKPPNDPALPKQEPGLRPARPLPYDLAADAQVADARLDIGLASLGAVGAHFHVTSSTDASGPWTYTVESGRRLSGSWAVSSAYDVTVHGPNGFLRRFAGDARSAGPEVSARHNSRDGRVRLVLSNKGSTSVRLTVADGYRCEPPATYLLPPGGSVVHTARPTRSNNWYDLSVTSDHDAAFLRRLAGHVETGLASTSDPAIGPA
jgi:phospholipase C